MIVHAGNNEDNILSNATAFAMNKESNASENTYSKFNDAELNKMLEEAVLNEDYEKAAKIRDELTRR